MRTRAVTPAQLAQFEAMKTNPDLACVKAQALGAAYYRQGSQWLDEAQAKEHDEAVALWWSQVRAAGFIYSPSGLRKITIR